MLLHFCLGLEYETLLNSLLLEIKQLTDELKKLESSQVVRAEMMLPNDIVALQNIYNQQKVCYNEHVLVNHGFATCFFLFKERKLHLERSIEPRYTDLIRRCNQALQKQIAIPTVDVLKLDAEQLTNMWESVSDLVNTYFIKYNYKLVLFKFAKKYLKQMCFPD